MISLRLTLLVLYFFINPKKEPKIMANAKWSEVVSTKEYKPVVVNIFDHDNKYIEYTFEATFKKTSYQDAYALISEAEENGSNLQAALEKIAVKYSGIEGIPSHIADAGDKEVIKEWHKADARHATAAFASFRLFILNQYDQNPRKSKGRR